MTSTAVGNRRIAQEAGDSHDSRLLLGAVELVLRALEASGPEGRGTVSAPASPPPLIGDKVRCEAAMLLRATAPLADHHPVLGTAVSLLASELAAADSDELAVWLCLHPGVALDLALVPLHLRALGLGDPRLDPLLDDLFGADRMRGPERQPNRELEQLWLHAMWSGEPDRTATARALSASSLAWEFDHISGTTDDAYAFTHAMLYATDHGRRRVRLPRPVEEVVADAEGILAVALDAGNHDVAAEALWTWPMLDLPWTPLAVESRGFLAQVIQRWGFLPGPGFDASEHQRLPMPDRDDYVLRTSYHTTLVHGLLSAAIMSREGRDQPDPSTGRTAAVTLPVPRHTADAVLALLPPRAAGEAWWSYLASRPSSIRDPLAPALVAMALRRAAGNADLPAVLAALSVAAHHRVPQTPVSRQAQILLRRAMCCVGLA